MRLSLTVFMCVMACITTVSCEKVIEWTPYEPLEFDIEGIELVHSGFDYLGVLPSSGAEFVLSRSGKHARWYETIYIDGVLQTPEEENHNPEMISGYKVISGEWGTAEHYKKESSYYTKFIIAPNETDKIREIEIHTDCMYEKARFKIKQLPEESARID